MALVRLQPLRRKKRTMEMCGNVRRYQSSPSCDTRLNISSIIRLKRKSYPQILPRAVRGGLWCGKVVVGEKARQVLMPKVEKVEVTSVLQRAEEWSVKACDTRLLARFSARTFHKYQSIIIQGTMSICSQLYY